MTVIDILRDEYLGDYSWQRFVDVFRPAWNKQSDKDFYQAQFGDEEIAIVLTSAMGPHAIDWFNKPCGALGKRAPVEIIQNETLGIRINRTLLMRMPR